MSNHDFDLSAPVTPRRRFFSRVDWAAFWTATLASFAVYAVTAAPSVTLEDAGELVTAGDHLGVPHPPGYPIWTVCAFLFARVLGFVTYMGQPNPAWAIAVMSGFFGAVAAGLTAMLITRSSSDMLADLDQSDDPLADRRRHNLLSWAGGVAGSLVFAFSPVEWSQSTIPEVYTLNALFLMWVFLLSYRWMRSPSNKVLWAVAFLFGLGLTNYQMLLFAIVPLAVIILLKDIALFRDLALTALPFLTVSGILMLAAAPQQPGNLRLSPWRGYEDLLGPPLASPSLYTLTILFMATVVGCAIAIGVLRRRNDGARQTKTILTAVAGAAGLALLATCLSFPTAPALPAGIAYAAPDQMFHWGRPTLTFLGLLGALWVFAAMTPGGRWYAAAVTAIELPLAILLRKGALMGLTHPLTGWFAFYVALNFAVLALAWALLPRGRSVAVAVLFAEAGVAFYGYMPISSDTNPPMNWGYPRTWEGFKHAITRGQYEKLVPTNPFDPVIVDQLGAYFADLRKQFTFLLAPLGFLPFTLWRLRLGAKRDAEEGGTARVRTFDCFAAAFALAVAVALFAAIDRLFNEASAFVPHTAYVAAIGAILACVCVGFAAVAYRQLEALWATTADRSRPASERVTAGLSLAAASGALVVFTAGMCRAVAVYRVLGVDGADPTSGKRAAVIALTLLLAVAAAAAFAGVAWLAHSRRTDADGAESDDERPLRLRMGIDDTAQQWFVALFACFFVMSFLVIVMAAPKGNLQDNFIQKVKFISSHAIYSLWIGYGLVFGLALVAAAERALRARRCTDGTQGHAHAPLAAAAALVLVVVAPLVPIYENYFNDTLVDETSSADQVGHDFGWQFGNYQLRGAEAIAEELSNDEEPLPNPDYPPAMTTNAVFYGGTDPGRFVPTYMIFSADVRPDVFLITQNALADNTYMDTMRDMYGERIWMPTPRDNAEAFEKYVSDVQSGRLPNLGGISTSGGRVQVNGALEVMEINGILSELIFRKNRDRHDFYVEESYAMRWMNPYAVPHGLILKVPHDPGPIPPERIRDDLDFWDWYSRRLLATPEFPRDFAARKSFSKLRSAIAGIYAARRDLGGPASTRAPLAAAAERAFRDAVRIYPPSPESCTRLVQEVLAPQMRFAEALRLLDDLRAADPNNRQLPTFSARIGQLEDARQRVEEISSRPSPGPADQLDLAEACLTLMRRGEAVSAGRRALEGAASLAPADRLRLALVLREAGDYESAARALETLSADLLSSLTADEGMMRAVFAILAATGRYELARNLMARHLRAPGVGDSDWRSWLEFALLELHARKSREASIAFDKARRIAIRDPEHAGKEFIAAVQADPDLSRLLETLYRPAAGATR